MTMIVKLGLIIALLSLLGGGVFWFSEIRYEAGFNQAILDYEKVQKEAQIKSDKAHALQLGELSKQLNEERQKSGLSRKKAISLQEQLNSIKSTAEDNREISKVKSTCTSLGSDYDRVLKSIISEAPSLKSNN